ncbi:hypothetical protein [Pseudomonas gingeri]|uniref:hypothetical protein n=1 Tax=Pseudomonas gingeri TaxID=117681 RepID=UPI0035271FFF
MILRNSHRAAQAHLQADTRTTATTEEVDKDLVILRVESESVLSFEVERVFLLVSGHRGSSPVWR